MRLFKVKNTQYIGPNTILLTLQPNRGKDKLSFYPGQYAAVGFKRHGRPSVMRCFSIVSSPNNPDQLQFAMRVYGDFTSAVAQLSQGDTVFVRGPFGNFVIDERYDKSVILLAGGIGVTPFMSMIRAATDTKLSIPFTLLYSCQSQDNVPFYEELLDLERRNPRFKVAFFITNGGIDKLSNGRVLTGRINEKRLDQLTGARYNQFTYFICGPKGFTEGLQSALANHGTDLERIITEEFTPSTQISTASISEPYNISRWTYSLTGVALVLGTFFIMTIDLVRAVPKLVNAQAIQTAATSQTTATQPTSSTPVSPSNNPSSPIASTDNSSSVSTTPAPTPTTTNNYQTSSPSPTTTTTTPQTQPYYQAPVTSVS